MGFFGSRVLGKTIQGGEVKYPKDFINKIICGDCLEVMIKMPTECVDLIVSSPPYFNLRDYSLWKTYDDYLDFMGHVADGLYFALKKGRFLFWNIQDSYPKQMIDSNQKGCFALSADIVAIFQDAGFEYETNIVWYRGKGTGTQRLFGSYPYPPTFYITRLHENILMFRKEPGYHIDVPKEKEYSKVTKSEWITGTDSIWTFQPEFKAPDHPAPYPVELPSRCIKLWSFVNDIIFDPFVGSGTTAVAAKNLKRNYLGIDIHSDYCRIAEERLAQGIL